MNSYAQKLDIIHWITELQDVSVLEQINLIKENTPVLSILEEKSIEEGLDHFRQGKVRSHLQVKKRYEKWLGN